MRVLVTGAAGFVGRHIVEALNPRLFGDPDESKPWVDAIDARDFKGSPASMFGVIDCRAYCRTDSSDRHEEMRPDLVFHCAAEVGGRIGIDENAAHLGAVNLQLDGALWEWALRTRPGRIVYFSSAAVYGTRLQDGPAHLLREEWTGEDVGVYHNPDETYGWAKLTGELMADRVRKAGVPVTVVRPFSMYDVDQDESSYPFPAFARRAARHDDPFVVWGDGGQVRDWLHIDDAVQAIFALVEAGVDGPVNLCTGVGTSMDELAAMAMAAAGYRSTAEGRPSRIQHLTDKPEGVRYRVGDPSLLHRYYRPRISVQEGMRRAVEAVLATELREAA